MLAQPDCTNTMECKITAPSGMRMRSEPSLKSKVVTYVPKDSIVSACTDEFGSMTYEEITGYWRKVKYNTKIGYMFDGFLEVQSIGTPVTPIDNPLTAIDSTASVKKDSAMSDQGASSIKRTEEPKVEMGSPDNSGPVKVEKTNVTKKEVNFSILTEAYNYCGDVQSIDPGLFWYGVYPKDDESANYRIKSVELNIILSKQKIGKGLEFDIQSSESERSIFLIGSNSVLPAAKGSSIKDVSEILRFNSRKVYPGQQWVLATVNQKEIVLSATGSVQTAGPCPDLENYKLILKGEKYFLPVEQDITKELLETGQCGMPEIYWYGDLNGDQIPEIIFVSVYDDRNQFTLFVSDPELDNLLLKKETQWVISNCN